MFASRAASSSVRVALGGIAPTKESHGIQSAPLAKIGTPLSTKRKKRVPRSSGSGDWSSASVRMPTCCCHAIELVVWPSQQRDRQVVQRRLAEIVRPPQVRLDRPSGRPSRRARRRRRRASDPARSTVPAVRRGQRDPRDQWTLRRRSARPRRAPRRPPGRGRALSRRWRSGRRRARRLRWRRSSTGRQTPIVGRRGPQSQP